MMEIHITPIAPDKMKTKPADENNLGFGKIFTDHLFIMKYTEKDWWHNASIEPYRPLILDPAAMCFHYAQEIFEGLKAYRGKDNSIYLFRPEANIRRMNRSAERLCMPPVDEAFFMDVLKKLVLLEKDWIPRNYGTSLYIRPTMIATEKAVGLHISSEYIFFIILSPVGAYYPQGFNPTKIYVNERYVRSAVGGTGDCKAAGNYAASFYAGKEANDMGYTQVLWLDAKEHRYVEEVGTSNIFFVIGDSLITPPLSGSILPGVTRESVIQLATAWGIPVEERSLSMDEILAAHRDGTLKEVFASGTAAVISPVGHIYYKESEYCINEDTAGPLAERLYHTILQIQYGEQEDPFGWRVEIT
jgi:branched-chain amino acid aminotransferase